MSFDTYDAKKQANIREIKARLENISTPYEACKMAYHKVARTWDSGGFSYGKYLSRSDPSGGLREVLNSRLLDIYVEGYHSAMLIAMAFGAVYAAGKRRHSVLFFSIVTLTSAMPRASANFSGVQAKWSRNRARISSSVAPLARMS